MFQRALLHPKFIFSKQKLVTWGSLSLNLTMVPSICVPSPNLLGGVDVVEKVRLEN